MTGVGIWTCNGYFQGVICATSGCIGGWCINPVGSGGHLSYTSGTFFAGIYPTAATGIYYCDCIGGCASWKVSMQLTATGLFIDSNACYCGKAQLYASTGFGTLCLQGGAVTAQIYAVTDGWASIVVSTGVIYMPSCVNGTRFRANTLEVGLSGPQFNCISGTDIELYSPGDGVGLKLRDNGATSGYLYGDADNIGFLNSSRAWRTLVNANGIYVCAGWLRTYSTNGWYNETYGGGIYMTDSTYVSVYNSKRFYVNADTYSICSNSSGNVALFGCSAAYAVYGKAANQGVYGYASSNYGGYFYAASSYGLCAVAASSYGVYGYSLYYGVYAQSAYCIALVGNAGTCIGVYGVAASCIGGSFYAPTAFAICAGSANYGILGAATSLYGVMGLASTYGVYGCASGCVGVYGYAATNTGVMGESAWCGVKGYASSGVGVFGCTPANHGVYGYAGTSYPVTGNGAYYNASSKTIKLVTVECPDVLTAIRDLQISQWAWDDRNQRGFDEFIGPFAEDVQRAFNLTFANDGVYQLDGVALRGVQQLDQKVTELENVIQSQNERIANLEAKLAA
jgi:hypothetical protein